MSVIFPYFMVLFFSGRLYNKPFTSGRGTFRIFYPESELEPCFFLL